MPVDILVGLQWGDEGKGKIVDILSPKYDIVARFQGGPNAGHTLVIEGEKFIFHTMPSGVIHEHISNILGTGMVIDPVTFRKEYSNLIEHGIEAKNRIFISKNASLICPSHKLLDRFYENQKGDKKVGTTARGIGPTYQDKIARIGLRFSDLLLDNFLEKYNLLKSNHLAKINEGYEYDSNVFNQEEEEWFQAIDFIKDFSIIDTETYINRELDKGAKVLAEGAQGSLLDINFGTFPYVTSSNTIASGACTGLGIAPQRINKIYGVFKAYTTRVGEGPFFTEQLNETGEEIMKKGHEFGSTTGRPRRCGWLDLVALKYAIMLNGVTDLVITKSDVLCNMETIRVCDNYLSNDGRKLIYTDYETQEIIPQYIEFASWNIELNHISNFNELPEDFKRYISYIEQECGLKISLISTGPDRSEIIYQ